MFVCRRCIYLVVGPHYLPLPVLAAHLLDHVNGHEFPQHVRQRGQLLLGLPELEIVLLSDNQQYNRG